MRPLCLLLAQASLCVLLFHGTGRIACSQSPAASGVLQLTSEPMPVEPHPTSKKIAMPRAFQRELARQALLLTARHEFSLVTRDQSLGDVVDPRSPNCIRADIRTYAESGDDVKFERQGQVLFEGHVNNIPDDLRIFRDPLEWEEANSRKEFIEALKKAGYAPKPIPKNPELKVPAAIAAEIEKMDHIAVFGGIRQLHQLIKEQGESPELLGALSRAYAHMAYLTQYVPDNRFAVYVARSALYAQRLIASSPESPWGYWHRAYAFIFIGFPNQTTTDLVKAAELGGKLETAPEWVRMADFARRYKVRDLAAIANNSQSPYSQTAAAMWMVSIRFSDRRAYRIEEGKKAIALMPGCLSMLDELIEWSGVAYNHTLTNLGPLVHAECIQESLTRIPGCPEKVKDLVGTMPARSERTALSIADIARSLMAAGPADHQEPSWAALGKTIEQWNLEHLAARALFLRASLGVDADDYIKEFMPAIQGTELEPIFLGLALSRLSPDSAYAAVGKGYTFRELNRESKVDNAMRSMPATFQIGSLKQQDIQYRIRLSDPLTEHSYYRIYLAYSESDKVRYLRNFQKKSTETPAYVRERIVQDYRSTDNRREQWSVNYGEHPDFHWAIARGAKLAGDYDTSIKHYQIYLEMVPDGEIWVGLGEAYFLAGKEEEWAAATARALDCEDYTLNHGIAAEHLAATYLTAGRFAEARPWAERAASTGAAWGYDILADCLILQGDRAGAMQLARQNTARYETSDWFTYATDLNDPSHPEAYEHQLQLMQKLRGNDHQDTQSTIAVYALLQNQPAVAVEALTKVYEKDPDPWNGMQLAIAAELDGKKELRDKLWKELADRAPNHAEYTPLCQLAAFLLAFNETGKFDKATYEILRATRLNGRNYSVSMDIITGRTLLTQGRREEALEILKEAARAWGASHDRMVAWKWLRDEGIDPVKLDRRLFRGSFQARQVEPKPQVMP